MGSHAIQEITPAVIEFVCDVCMESRFVFGMVAGGYPDLEHLPPEMKLENTAHQMHSEGHGYWKCGTFIPVRVYQVWEDPKKNAGK